MCHGCVVYIHFHWLKAYLAEQSKAYPSLNLNWKLIQKWLPESPKVTFEVSFTSESARWFPHRFYDSSIMHGHETLNRENKLPFLNTGHVCLHLYK